MGCFLSSRFGRPRQGFLMQLFSETLFMNWMALGFSPIVAIRMTAVWWSTR